MMAKHVRWETIWVIILKSYLNQIQLLHWFYVLWEQVPEARNFDPQWVLVVSLQEAWALLFTGGRIILIPRRLWVYGTNLMSLGASPFNIFQKWIMKYLSRFHCRIRHWVFSGDPNSLGFGNPEFSLWSFFGCFLVLWCLALCAGSKPGNSIRACF